MPVLFTNENSEKAHDIADDPAKGAAMLNAPPFRLTLLSARADTATNRVLATAMVMLAAAIAPTDLTTTNKLDEIAKCVRKKPKTLRRKQYGCLLRSLVM